MRTQTPFKPMNIRTAARWAEHKDVLYWTNRYTGQPEYMYAVYDLDTHLVVCIGSYDKCNAIMPKHGQKTADGKWLKMEALEAIVEQMAESDGEAGCIPDISEQREWA